MEFAFPTDEDTRRFFEITVEALKRHFGHSEKAAIELVNEFQLHNPYRLEDDWIFHEGAYAMAARVHYFQFLLRHEPGFEEWRRKEGHWNTPEEFMEYLRDLTYDRPLIAQLWQPKRR